MFDKQSFKVIKVLLTIIPLITSASLIAQTLVTAPITSTPAAGNYYSLSSISLQPTISFTATTSSTLSFRIANADCQPLVTSASAAQNYIMTSIPRVGGITSVAGLANLTACDLMQSIQYFDGLGRPLQTVQVKGSPADKDMVQPLAYDQFGREVTKYLPYAYQGTSDGSYKADAFATTGTTSQNYFYNNPPASSGVGKITTPEASTAFEPSPLNRINEQGAPGDAWQLTGTSVTTGTAGHTIRTIYTTNNATAVTDTANTLMARIFTVTINPDQSRTLTSPGIYAAGQLYVTITRSENIPVTGTGTSANKGGTVEEYKDKLGRMILKRTFNYLPSTATLQILSTYYVYDTLGNLCFVLPPGTGTANADSYVPTQTILITQCYQYQYDWRNRLVQKRIPGKGWDYIVYNTLDQPVATQDSMQRVANQWIYTKYDAIGRPITTGIWTNGTTPTAITRVALQGSVNSFTTYWETPSASGYSNAAWPISYTTPLTINYYDKYTNIPSLPAAYNAPSGYNTQTTGLLTATLTAVLNTPTNMLWTAHYYDGLGRLIKSYAQHYLGSVINNGNYDAITTSYDFTSNPLKTVRQHYNTTNTTTPVITITNNYTYDHMGRKIATWEQITNGTTTTTRTLISKLDYNEIGQLVNKHLHSTDSINYLQNVAYTYNERGWVLSNSAPLFQEQLQYNSVNNISGITPKAQYNGNIASQSWGTSVSPNTSSYLYRYDQLNRLTSGMMNGNSYGERSITYDTRGNISTLSRMFNGTLIDSLTYTYPANSNTFSSILDNSADAGTTGVKTGTSAYVFNGNGNMVTDNNKGLAGITYNLLNLPQTFPSKSITYTYDANGQKLRRVNGTAVTDYIAGVQYDGTSSSETITFIQTEEGRALPNGTSAYNYEYNLADHLGDTRLTFDTGTGSARTEQQDNYLPFGLDVSVGTIGSPQNYYLYNKKELQSGLALYDFGARFYDPMVGRWAAIDVHAEKYTDLSPFVYVFNDPLKHTDPDGKDGVKVVDKENQTVTVKANYYVPTIKGYKDDNMVGYTTKDIQKLNTLYNSMNGKSLTVTDGQYKGYKVKFDITFKDGGTSENSQQLSANDKIEGHSIGNTFTKADGNSVSYFFPKVVENDDGTTNSKTRGGVTKDHKDVTMNSNLDSKRNKIHETFHTFFFDHDNADKGIGSYQTNDMPNQNDINSLINNVALPAVENKKDDTKHTQ